MTDLCPSCGSAEVWSGAFGPLRCDKCGWCYLNVHPCDVCGKPIPIARLQALPYTSSCIDCQRQQERVGRVNNVDADWESVYEYQAKQNDQELTLSDIQIDV